MSSARQPTTRVAVVEDHQLYREMLVASLMGEPSVTVSVVAAGAQEARARIAPGAVDVALLDVDLPDGNGVALGVQLRRRDPDVAVMLLSAQDVLALLLDMPADVRRGWSYLSKSSALSTADLVRALHATAEGRTVLDAELVRRARPRRASSLEQLSPRQREVLRLVATGMSNSAVGAELGISTHSVENHLSGIYTMLHLPADQNPRVAAVLRFIEETSRD